jgi:hypothetical protein
MLARKPTNFPLLLEVFREGLTHGVISKKQITNWADKIIMEDENPDYFFIELSLGRDDQLIEVLNKYKSEVTNVICARVLFALIYRKLLDDQDDLTIEGAAVLLGRLIDYDDLELYEYHNICAFEEYELYYYPDLTQLQVDLINFLSIYQDFTFDNIEQWPQINSSVEVVFKNEQEKDDAIRAANTKVWEKRERIRKIKRTVALALIILVGVLFVYALLIFSLVPNKQSNADFWRDNQSSIVGFGFVLILAGLRKLLLEKK